MITSSDIQLLLSGGSSNQSADRSLGGEASSFTVQQTIQSRLFDDVSNADAKAGYTDHRCLYLHNRSDLYNFYDTTLSIPAIVSDGAEIGIGCLYQTDTQRLTVRGLVGYGSIKLRYYLGSADQTVTAEYDSDTSVWAANIQNALNSIAGIETTVTALTNANIITFTISFVGISDNRFHLPLVVESSSLEGNPVISIEKTRDGSPFNSTASVLETKTAIPPNVVFNEDGLYLGTMQPGDAVPIWVKRIVRAGTEAIEDDGFTLDISGSADAG